MASTYGTLKHGDHKGTPSWFLEPVPYVATRIKRIFPRINHYTRGTLVVADTPEVAADIEWVLSRWPMLMSADTAEHLAHHAAAFREQRDVVQSILDGYVPPTDQRDTAVPLRHYQEEAAAIIQATGRLLLCDELGLGKTASTLAVLRDPANLPACVVCLTNLPVQWAREVKKFLPWLVPHIIPTGPVYDPIGDQDVLFGNTADVIIIPYSRLSKWASYLAGKVRYVIFDEMQELRHQGTNKYQAAAEIADLAGRVAGASVTGDAWLDLSGGPFGAGWVGPISDAFSIVAKCNAPDTERTTETIHTRGHGIESRGWDGVGFAWKPVDAFVRHLPPETSITTATVCGVPLSLTHDHSVYVAGPRGFDLSNAADLTIGSIVGIDNGRAWTKTEDPVDVLAVAAAHRAAQVVVDLAGVDRFTLGMTAWQWQNSHRGAIHGARIPLSVYLEHQSALPRPSSVYLSSGRGARRMPPTIMLSRYAYMLGFYLGDGWTEGTRIAFAVENELVDSFMAYLRLLRRTGVDIDPTVSTRVGRGSSEVRFGQPLMADIIRAQLGDVRCSGKAIPGEWVVAWPEHARRDLLCGLIDSDGHIRKGSGRRTYTTTSPDLARSLTALLRSLNIRGSISTQEPRVGGTVRNERIVGRQRRFNLSWSGNAEHGKNDGGVGLRSAHSWTRGRVIESRIRDVRRVEHDEEWVYDLAMEGHPSFVASGVLVHNTGTPVYNYGDEMHHVMQIIAPDMLGTEEEFKREWCREGYGKPLVADPAALGTYLRDQGLMLYRTRADVGRELPEVSRIEHAIDIDGNTLNNLTGDAADLARTILDTTGTVTNFDRMQAAGDLDWKLRHATGVAKAPFVADFVRMLVESGEPVVLFGWHRAVYDIWLERLANLNPAMYTGSETGARKINNANLFLDGHTDLLIMSLRSAAGLDGLQERCKVCVFGELDWSPGVHAQAIGRIHRDGQTDPVLAYFLVAESGSDPVVADVLNIKRQQADPILDPNAEKIETVDTSHRVRLLAEAFLANH